jgi:hypothetical protein
MSTTVTYAQNYTQRFPLYTKKSNSKDLIAFHVAELASQQGKSRLIDLGSGDGVLLSKLRHAFSRITAVEVKEEFSEKLQKVADCVIITPVENLDIVSQDFNCILANYSINGLASSDLQRIFDSVRSSPPHQDSLILLGTEGEKSNWTDFAHQIHEMLGDTKISGAVADIAKIKAAGANPVLVKEFDSIIYGKDLDDLAYTLGCFFTKRLEVYDARREEVKAILAPLTEEREVNGQRVTALPVVEQIYSIHL